jgi:hypothetical protein
MVHLRGIGPLKGRLPMSILEMIVDYPSRRLGPDDVNHIGCLFISLGLISCKEMHNARWIPNNNERLLLLCRDTPARPA